MAYNSKVGGKPSKTPWTKPKTAVGLTSDAIKPRRSPNPPQSSTAGNKGTKAKDAPKSREIRDIEAIIDSIEKGVDDKAGGTGCFCLARTHELSPYLPLCPHCGFIMCELQNPSSSCPSCLSPVLSPTERTALLARLQNEKQAILQREADQKEAERLEQLRQQVILAGGGDFPTLSIAAGATTGSSPLASGTSTPRAGFGAGGASGRQTPVQSQDEGPHKVLSLNSRTKKITVSTYTQPPAHAISQIAKTTVDEEIEEGPKPIPPPPIEVEYITAQRPSNRKWLDLRGDGLTYIPLEIPGQAPGTGTEDNKQKRKRNRGKAKGKETQVV